MSNCSVCGEETRLHVMGAPICVKCDKADPQERKIRGGQRQAPPEFASVSLQGQSQTAG